jgi:hypothetical protein
MKNGMGLMIYKNGSSFFGEFKNDRLTPNGDLKLPNGKI